MATDDFTHILMTRFNLPTGGRETAHRAPPGWLGARFDLFERFCLPSVAAQSAQNFGWILYFDAATPPEFRARIAAAQQVRPFVPVYTGLFGADGWRATLEAAFPRRTPWLMTSTLDNDDALAADYMERLQDAARAEIAGGGGRVLFNFPAGHVLAGPALYRLRHRRSPFFAHLEPWGAEIRPALAIHHMRLGREGRVRQLPGPGAWMQIVHGGNVSNRARGWQIGPAGLAGRYPAEILAQVRAPGPATFVAQNLILGPLRRLRDGLSALVPR